MPLVLPEGLWCRWHIEILCGFVYVVRAGSGTMAARCQHTPWGVRDTKTNRLHIHAHHRALPKAFGAYQFMMMGIMIATTGVLFIKAEMKPMGMIMRTSAAAVEKL